MPAGKRAFIEIKSGPEAISPLAKTIDRICRPADDIVLMSFDLQTVRIAKRTLSEHQAYWIVSQENQDGRWEPTAEQIIAQVIDASADGLNLEAKPCVDGALINQIHAAGLKVF